MIVKNLEVSEIRAVKVDSKTKKASIQVLFTNDTPINMQIQLDADDYDVLMEKIIKQIKQEKRPVDDEQDDVLCGIAIVNVVNDDELRERTVKGLFQLEKKLDNFKRITRASEYMKAYGQLSTLEEVVYKKGH
ncbi:hypothetical protein HZB00_03775 [Candidatus Woesearchaeota archaeon]|nr:hypothetical protein [Candidatus Woesearchaeota archaeon]